MLGGCVLGRAGKPHHASVRPSESEDTPPRRPAMSHAANYCCAQLPEGKELGEVLRGRLAVLRVSAKNPAALQQAGSSAQLPYAFVQCDETQLHVLVFQSELARAETELKRVASGNKALACKLQRLGADAGVPMSPALSESAPSLRCVRLIRLARQATWETWIPWLACRGLLRRASLGSTVVSVGLCLCQDCSPACQLRGVGMSASLTLIILCGGLRQEPNTAIPTAHRHTRFCLRKSNLFGSPACWQSCRKAPVGLSGARAQRSGSPASATCAWHLRPSEPASRP